RARSARRPHRGDAEDGDRHRPAEAVQRRRYGCRPGEPPRAVPALVRDLRQGQRLQPQGRRGVHPPLRPGDQDRGGAGGRAGPNDRRRRGGGLMPAHQPTETPPPPPPPAPQMWGGRFPFGPGEAPDALNRGPPVAPPPRPPAAPPARPGPRPPAPAAGPPPPDNPPVPGG